MMTIEQKAEAYDKAIKVAKDIRNGKATYISNETPVIEAIFPELKENSDEEIRKDDDIEYTSTDAFIEKALEWICKEIRPYYSDVKYKYEDFKNYMKGE